MVNRYKIHSCMRIIVSFQADAAAVVDVGVVGHGFIQDKIYHCSIFADC